MTTLSRKYLTLNNLIRLYAFRLKDLDPSDVDPDESDNYKMRITKLLVLPFLPSEGIKTRPRGRNPFSSCEGPIQ